MTIYKDPIKGFNFYKIRLLIDIEPRLTDIYISTVKGDRLDLIADQYYNRVDLWWIIAMANNIGLGTMYLTDVKQLRIPMQITEILNKLNT